MATSKGVAAYESMEYGLAPESEGTANAYLDSHGRSFGFFLNGQFVKPEGRKTYTTYSPATGEKLADTLIAEAADIDVAVENARTAFATWSKTPGHVRARHMYSIARHLQKHHRLLAVLESMDNGKPIRETRDADVPLAIRHFYHHAGWAQVMDTEMAGYKPLGVIGQVIPWNFPLLMLAWKIAPALAMGNVCILKPALWTPLTAFLFCQICAEAGLPPGVVQIVTGPGSTGGFLVGHPGIDKVAFTGSTEVGRLLRRQTAGTGKKLSLELGGKNPMLVFDSADLDSAVEGVVDAIWFNNGQVCCAGSRLLVQENVHDKVVKKIKERMSHLRVGHPLDKAIDLGAIVDKQQFENISRLVQIGRDEGAEVYQCTDMPSLKGYFFPPTLVTGVQSVSTLVQEEVFGPVLVVQSFRTPEEAVALANNTRYGLGASVWTENIGLATETAVKIKAGVVWVNSHNLFDAAAGFGGYKESGFGREGGKEGLYMYVRQNWESPERPTVTQEMRDNKKWGTAPPALPVPASVQPLTASSDPTGVLIDRTAKLFIGGKQARPDGMYSLPVLTPGGEVISQVPDSNRKDVRNAVEAAHAAFPGWGARAAYNRSQILFYLAENLSVRRDEFAARLDKMTGCGVAAGLAEVDTSIDRLFTYAAYADKWGGRVQETTLHGMTVALHEPVGVIGIACPSESPLLGFISLFAPAIVRGNTVVVIPSPEHPLAATDLYQVFETSDIPAGVVNILTGQRDVMTKTLVEHEHVDAMWYFGGGVEGSYHVEFLAAGNLKRTFVDHGHARQWMDRAQGQGEEFLHEATEVKNVWVPMGE